MSVTWVELPPDAPEPGPLSVVNDGRRTWLHLADGWHPVDSSSTGTPFAWPAITVEAPLYVAEDPDAMKSCNHPDPVDALYITEAAARLAVEHYKDRPYPAGPLTSPDGRPGEADARLIATATALAGFLRGETGTGEG